MSKIKFFSIVLFAIITVGGCKKSESAASVKLPPGFEDFYKKFHEDSIYQIDHILFPLEGLPSISDNPGTEDFHWDLQSWIMHRSFTDFKDYDREFIVLDSTIVIEKIQLKNKEYGMERRFAKSGNQWQLIYYAAMNKLIKNPALQQDSVKTTE